MLSAAWEKVFSRRGQANGDRSGSGSGRGDRDQSVKNKAPIQGANNMGRACAVDAMRKMGHSPAQEAGVKG
ncbi:hypothetical protein TRP8649_01911 [Pelagimonas phthalicica]|uniref:Uncharacterized protein n=1 Tax=Pelagimonas phthalicica TaxID=1037362 RepID=A0A238JAR5_9RHOB|nr:hypothetical protein CLV87_0161 [Pelagimonas phthalicica]SMX27801.1 hypothetical protein TRP8649_01911 [Pelagimonas phthalicica]